MKRALTFLLALTLVLFGIESANAASSLSLKITKTPSIGEPKVTLNGILKPARANVQVAIQVKLNGAWSKTSLGAKTKSSGSWKIEVVSTALAGSATYRAVAGRIFSNQRTFTIDPAYTLSEADPNLLISLAGPGGRIHGVDISWWQHPGDKLIDFERMFKAGVRFVMIKASDGKDKSDIDARKWLSIDMDAALAAGLYTGFYHYAYLPNSTDEATVITEAQTQAQKAIWRLASVGGYNERSLPYALDIENNCIQYSGSKCVKYTSKKLVTLFASTWLSTVKTATGRTPMLYSSSKFLENAMIRNTELRNYPLWQAHYGINPFDPLGQPGQKISGCFVHSWTTSNCSSEWVIWQYSSCGIGKKYGVPSGRVDLNVYRGDIGSFLELTKGIWVPQVADLMPINEPTSMQLLSATYSTSDKPAIFNLNVLRPSLLPVVTGTVKLVLPDKNILLDQSAVRAKNGSFTLNVKGIPVGTWDASLQFIDQSGTHAKAMIPFQIVMGEGIKPTPIVSPSAKPGTSTKVPADACRGQIIN
ncbi:MAG: glycoside hydrolase family 25 protein [Candidatus Nanopelagicaceae bacterium]